MIITRKIHQRLLMYSIVIVLVLASLLQSAFAENLPHKTINKNQYFRPILTQLGKSCGNLVGVSYVFNYEINLVRDLPSGVTENQYPYCYTFHFLNNGDANSGIDLMFLDAWDIIKENGIPTTTDYGGFTTGFPTGWLNGYNKYFSGMHNRISDYFSIELKDSSGLNDLKRWLNNHRGESSIGGICAVALPCDRIKIEELPPQTNSTESSKVIIDWAAQTSGHAMTIIGYDDSIKYDFNKDGKFTSTIDINGDGMVDIRDSEYGAVLLVDPFGIDWADSGQAYTMYRSFFTSLSAGGLNGSTKAYCVRARKEYKPLLTYKITLTHSKRNQIRIIPGVSKNSQDTTPSFTINYKKQFNFSGGDLPMRGKNQDSTLEIGLDVTEFLNIIGESPAKFFLTLESREGEGRINSFSLIDYTGGTVKEKPCPTAETPIKTGVTRLSIGVAVPCIIKNEPIGSNQRTLRVRHVQSDRIDFEVPEANPKGCSFMIYNAKGMQIFLRNNSIADNSHNLGHTTFSWNINGQKITAGTYCAVISTIQHNGNQKQYRSKFTVY